MLTLATFLFNALANFALGLGVAYFLGAEEFGVYALAAAAGSILQTIFYEWLRLSTNRFYGEKQGAEDSGIITTLNVWTGGISIALSLVALALYLGGGTLGVSALVAAMGPLITISNGLFDYRAAVARTCFHHRRYAALVIVKNLAALVFVLGGAFWWRKADLVLVGLCVSSLAGVLVSARFFSERRAMPRPQRFDLVRQFVIYAVPLIVSSLLIQLNMFLARSAVAWQYGVAESGRYSLALDIAVRLLMTIGSGLDLVLFQYAVRAEAEEGIEAARRQLGLNILMITGVLLPSCVGLWLILPSFEVLFVSESYRGAFSYYSTLLLPGMFFLCLVFYVINPLFQIARKTLAVIYAAAIGLAAAALVLFALPGTDGGHGAVATSFGFFVNAALMAWLAWRIAPVAVPWGELAKVCLATLGMVAATLPLRHAAPGPLMLLCVVALAVSAYLLINLALNTGNCRGLIRARLRPAAAVA